MQSSELKYSSILPHSLISQESRTLDSNKSRLRRSSRIAGLEAHISEAEAINVLQISELTIESLFDTATIDACENASNEPAISSDNDDTTYGDDGCAKKRPHSEELDTYDRPQKKVFNYPDVPTPSIRKLYRLSRKREQEKKNWDKCGHVPRPSTKEKYVGGSQPWKTSVIATKLSMKAGGYTSTPSSFKNLPEIQSLEEATALGFIIVKSESFHQPITDNLGRVLAVLAPPPSDPTYFESAQQACNRMKEEITRASFHPKDLINKQRGDGYYGLNLGLSYGQGLKTPTLRNVGRFQNLANALLADRHIQRLASYQDATYALWHPKAYQYYIANLNKLWEEHPMLHPTLFPKSIMPSVTFNLGTRVVTKKHVDSQNCPFGWCTITALGDFDASKGGHLLLWDLGLALEFPAGACICLPSALITHSNIPTSENETRMSFTQYCSGEIFRFIENGFRTDSDLTEKDPAILLFRKNVRKDRIKKGYEMFSNINDLMRSPESKGSKI